MRKRIICVLLMAAIIVGTIMPNMALAASASSAGTVESTVLKASYDAQTGIVIVNTLPDEAAALVLAGYNGGQMVFSEWAEGLEVPVQLTVPENSVYDSLKVFCLDADHNPITKAKQVYPVVLHTVKFVGNGDGVVGVPETQTVVNREYAQKPADPTREGYRFLGWITQADGTEKYDFSAEVAEDITLYALWAKQSGQVNTRYEFDETHVQHDSNEHVSYIDNMILAFVEDGLSETEKDEIAADIDGVVVGSLEEVSNVLQIRVASTTLSELKTLSEELMEHPSVQYATFDAPVGDLTITGQVYSDTDPWEGGSTWSETSPGGGNWGWEAIHAYSAWNTYGVALGEIIVGIIDNGFDATHEDLRNKINVVNPDKNREETPHGTCVAGIIAAKNNDIGVCGVANNADLVCCDLSDAATDTHVDVFDACDALISRGASVISMSMALDVWDEDNFEDNSTYKDYDAYMRFTEIQANTTGILTANYISNIVRSGYDSLFVQCAGNGYNNAYAVPHDASLSGYFASCTEEITDLVENRDGLEQGEIRSHILVVTSIENEYDAQEGYALVSGACRGETVDICAPGRNVYTTKPGNTYRTDFGGTSAATPFVSGVAALAWSINEDLTAAQVKEILVNETTEVGYGNGGGMGEWEYPLVNAYAAAKKAYEMIDKSDYVIGSVKNAETGAGIGYANITIYDEEETFYAGLIADSNGAVEQQLGIPSYITTCRVEITADGYEKVTLPNMEVTGGGFNFGAIELRPGYSVSGQVTDGSGGLSGVSVVIRDQDNNAIGAAVVTGETGTYSIPKIPNGTYTIIGTKVGYNEGSVGVTVSDGNATAPVLPLEKIPFTLTHTSADGSTVTDLIAKAENDANSGIALCNNAGVTHWTAGGIKSVSAAGDWFALEQAQTGDGTFDLAISVKGYTLGRNTGTITFELLEGDPYVLNVYQQAHTISGTVTDEAGPVANASVVIWNTDGFRSDPIITGADGTFSLAVYDAWYSITVTTEEYGEKTVDLTTPVNMCDVTADIYLALPNGTCGDDLTWVLSKDGVLTVSGSGDMYDYSYEEPAPWYDHREKITELVVETGVTSIGDYAFDRCALTSMSLPTSMRTIGFAAFGVTGLTQVTIPEGVETLGSSAFYGCDDLVSVSIPSTVTSLGTISAGGSLARIEVSEENAVYCDIDGVLFSKDGTLLREYPAGRRDMTYQIPDGTLNVVWGAFTGARLLVNLIVPESVTRFVTPFSGCTGLKRIYFYGDLPTLSLPSTDATLYYIEGKSGWTSPTYTNSDGDVYNTATFDPDEVETGAYVVANGTCGTDLTWVLDSTATLTISGTGAMTDYTSYSAIPWYEYRGSIIELVVEEGVESLGQHAFYYCYQLSEVTLPDSLKSIGRYAFESCTDLKSFTVPVGVTSIGAGALGCANLTQIEVASGNEYFEAHDGVLFTRNKVSLIKYPEGKQDYHYVLPDGVQSVAEDAFTGAFGNAYTDTDGTVGFIGLGSVTFPASVTDIAWQDYSGSYSYLQDLYFEGTAPEDNAGYNVGVEWDARSVIHFKWGQTQSDSNRIVSDWTSSLWTSPTGAVYQTVCDDAIATISGTVQDTAGAPIEDVVVKLYDQSGNAQSVYALSDATGAYQFQIGTAGTFVLELTKVGYETHTANVALNAAVSSVGTAVMQDNSVVASGTSGLAQWTLDMYGVLTVSGSGNVDDNDWSAYREQVVELSVGSGITGIEISDSMAFVNGVMYNGYDNLQTIRLSETVSSLDMDMNGSFRSISCIEVDPANLVYSSIDGVLYSADGSTLIKYPAAKTDVSFTVPDGVAVIEDYAFQYCSYLEEVEFPTSLRSIGVEAFRGSGIREAVLPSGLTTIEDEGFYNAYRLETVLIPDTLVTMGAKVFDSCGSLTEFTVDEGNEAFCVVDGVLFNSDKTELHYYPAGKSDLTVYTIPSTVVSLVNGIDNDYLTEIEIGRKVEDIGSGFGYCFKLECITVNGLNSVYASEDGVLFDKDKETLLRYPCAKADTSYTVPDTVVTIADSAFYNCDNLTAVYLPAGVDTIENNAFGYSEKLVSLYFYGSTPTNLARYAFGYSANSNLILYYVEGMTGWTTPTWTDANGKTYNTMTFEP